MGIFIQLSGENLTALFAMMQRVQGPQWQYVSVYNVLDAGPEKEAGNQRTWSDPVKVKHWAQRLDTDTHIVFPESEFQEWSAYGAIQSVGRREILKGSAIPVNDLTQPTISEPQEEFFCAWHGLPVARHRKEIPCVSAAVAGSALSDPRGV